MARQTLCIMAAENEALRAEVERLTRERDKLYKCEGEQRERAITAEREIVSLGERLAQARREYDALEMTYHTVVDGLNRAAAERDEALADV